ncbi:hypothetical protein [uncultured Acinetobacter sp.]|uniref:hypothetical protein n=1 Tax=uncultured Acinetobacter sp. TaxID=165433 RepID=UPI003748FB85
MDKKRNIELENWLIETTGEEMMANHLGPNWNRFHEECGFYPNISMTIADQVWEHKQKWIDELQKSANEMDEYITTAQRCLPYYLLDQESDENWIGGVQNEIVRLEQKNDELQARVDAVKGLAQALWEKSNDKHNQGKVWESKALGECADEILDVLEQALKGGEV